MSLPPFPDVLVSCTRHLGQWFWNESIWLPPNVSWSDLKSVHTGAEQVKYSDFSDLAYPIPAALVIIAIRAVFEW